MSMGYVWAILAALTTATTSSADQRSTSSVPSPVAVDRQENGYTWRYYFHEVPSTHFQFRPLSQAEWYLVWSALDYSRRNALTVRYECKLAENGDYAFLSPACRADCPSDQQGRLCREVGQRYFDLAIRRKPSMPADHDPERANRRYVAFEIAIDPATRPLVNFDQGEQTSSAVLISNLKRVVRNARNLMPTNLKYDGGVAAITVRCKVLPDRSVACRKSGAEPERRSRELEAVAERFALIAEPVTRLPDGRDPVGMTFSQTVRFEVND
jgi:hypothetical protein